jgi:DNA-binding protein HU-beta
VRKTTMLKRLRKNIVPAKAAPAGRTASTPKATPAVKAPAKPAEAGKATTAARSKPVPAKAASKSTAKAVPAKPAPAKSKATTKTTPAKAAAKAAAPKKARGGDRTGFLAAQRQLLLEERAN